MDSEPVVEKFLESGSKEISFKGIESSSEIQTKIIYFKEIFKIFTTQNHKT